MKLPVASEMPRCAPPHTGRAGEEPEEGRGSQAKHPAPVPGHCLKSADIMSADRLGWQKTRLQNQVVFLTDNGQSPSDARLAVTPSEQELISSKRICELVLDEDRISRTISN